jgi:anti-sigma factor RsiW
MNCREFAALLQEFLFGNLPAGKRVQSDNHLADCPCCIAYLDSYLKTMQLGKVAFSGPADAPLQADVLEDLIQAILRARSPAS